MLTKIGNFFKCKSSLCSVKFLGESGHIDISIEFLLEHAAQKIEGS